MEDNKLISDQMRMFLVLIPIVSSFFIKETINQTEKMKFLEMMGPSLNNVLFHYIPGEDRFILRAMQNITQKSNLISMPLDLTVNTFDYYPWFSLLVGTNSSVQLAGRLIYEKLFNPEKQYLSIHYLPTKFPTVYNKTEKDALQKEAKDPVLSLVYIDYEQRYWEYYKAVSRNNSIEVLCPICLSREAWLWGYTHAISYGMDFPRSIWKALLGLPQVRVDETAIGKVFNPLNMFIDHLPQPLKFRGKGGGMKILRNSVISYIADRSFVKDTGIVVSKGTMRSIDSYIELGYPSKSAIDDGFYVQIEKTASCPYDSVDKVDFCEFFLKSYQLNMPMFNYIYKRFAGPNADSIGILPGFYRRSKAQTKEMVRRTLIEYKKLAEGHMELCKMSLGEAQKKKDLAVGRVCLNYRLAAAAHRRIFQTSFLNCLMGELKN